MKLTNPEELTLMMLAEIHEALKIKDPVDTKLLKSTIYTGNTSALPWEMPGILRSEDRRNDHGTFPIQTHCRHWQ